MGQVVVHRAKKPGVSCDSTYRTKEGSSEPIGTGPGELQSFYRVPPKRWVWHGSPFSARIHSPTYVGRPPPSRPDLRPPARKRYCVQSLPER